MIRRTVPVVSIYTKDECSLCDKAKSVIAAVSHDVHFIVEEIDITSDPAVYEKFREQIPVIYINGKIAFKYFVDEKKLREKLDRCR